MTTETKQIAIPFEGVQIVPGRLSPQVLGHQALGAFDPYELGLLDGSQLSATSYRDEMVATAVDLSEGELSTDQFDLSESIILPNYIEDLKDPVIRKNVQLPTLELNDVVALKGLLALHSESLERDALEVTIAGKPIRFCDLRPDTGIDVDSQILKEQNGEYLLDKQFVKDVKVVTIGANTVKRVLVAENPTLYSDAAGGKLRTYWRRFNTVTSENDEPITTIVRLADCGSVSGQQTLYRQLLGKKMGK